MPKTQAEKHQNNCVECHRVFSTLPWEVKHRKCCKCGLYACHLCSERDGQYICEYCLKNMSRCLGCLTTEFYMRVCPSCRHTMCNDCLENDRCWLCIMFLKNV